MGVTHEKGYRKCVKLSAWVKSPKEEVSGHQEKDPFKEI